MVYVVQQQANKNVLPAQAFGKIKFLLPEGRNIMFSSGAVVQQLNGMLSNFKDEDYLLLVGDPAAIGLATSGLLASMDE